MIMSLSYLPFFDHYLFNVTNFLFLVFFVLFIVKEILLTKNTNLNLSNFILSLTLVLFLTKFTMYEQLESILSFKSIKTITYNMDDLNDATQLYNKFDLFDSVEEIQNSSFFAKRNNEMKNFVDTEEKFKNLKFNMDFVNAIQNKSTSIYNTYR